MTATNEITDYILNPKKHSQEPRIMFFHLLYGSEHSVEGFSEFAYLPENQVLVLDYLCTKQRNHVLFYDFYHMVVEEIVEALEKKEQFVRYILTELSLTKRDGKLIDADSNYFRHLLSNENYKLLKYPYYQPPLSKNEEAREFNLAIKLITVDVNSTPTLGAEQYLDIVQELYYSHYLPWYSEYQEFKNILEELMLRIRNEMPSNTKNESIQLIQCQLFEEDQCPKFTAENITLPRVKEKKRKIRILVLIWGILTVLTFVFCTMPSLYKVTTIICSFLTIIAGIISIVSFRKDFFGSK